MLVIVNVADRSLLQATLKPRYGSGITSLAAACGVEVNVLVGTAILCPVAVGSMPFVGVAEGVNVMVGVKVGVAVEFAAEELSAVFDGTGVSDADSAMGGSGVDVSVAGGSAAGGSVAGGSVADGSTGAASSEAAGGSVAPSPPPTPGRKSAGEQAATSKDAMTATEINLKTVK